MDGLQREVTELAQQLRQEKFFVSAEREQLQSLNERVMKGAERLFHLAWVTGQQRANLDSLVVARPDCSPQSCCQRAAALDQATFVDGYKQLGIQESIYGEFLQSLRDNPKLLASCLTLGDKLTLESSQSVINTVLGTLYGYCVLPEDEVLALRLLRFLVESQLRTADRPRLILKRGNCAFSRLYRAFSEGSFAARLFLTAALHEPIMHLLQEDQTFLDPDVNRGAFRLTADERARHIGSEDSPEYPERLRAYRDLTVNRLVGLTRRFVDSLRSYTHCFPAHLAWLVQQVALATGGGDQEVRAVASDLVFSLFVCPAVVNPEPHGIVDVPIGPVARFNLMQVAQILQVLAMGDFDLKDDLYGNFDKECLTSFVDSMLDGHLEEDPPLCESSASSAARLTRSAALATETDLQQLICYLRSVSQHLDSTEATDNNNKDSSCPPLHEVAKALMAILAPLPATPPALFSPTFTPPAQNHNSTPPNASPQLLNGGDEIPDTPKRSLLSKVSRSRNRPPHDSSEDVADTRRQDDASGRMEPVLVISFPNARAECVGMMSEQKVLSLVQAQGKNRVRMNLSNHHHQSHSATSSQPLEEGEASVASVVTSSAGGGGVVGETTEKRTRFSLSHDEGSIGNTSDNLEAVSEAASNHSVASSLELENEDQVDNLSDMVSANVSGRGSPNVSGRDTPSSQVTEGEGEQGAAADKGQDDPRAPLRTAPSPRAASLEDLPVSRDRHKQQSRSDIEDKFGRFEIKPLIEGDETVSMVSDTWSTDVLASDSETLEQQDRAEHPPGADILTTGRQLSDGGTGTGASGNLLDISETASEAWSMDVVASDSDRLGEVDTDDTSSVARSDDTARSEVEVEVPSVEYSLRSDVAVDGSDDGTLRPNVSGSLFRPIREENPGARGLPPPPLRIDGGALLPRSPERRLDERTSLDEVDSCLSGTSSRRDSSASLQRLVAMDSLPPDSPRSIESYPKAQTLKPVPVVATGSLPTLDTIPGQLHPQPHHHHRHRHHHHHHQPGRTSSEEDGPVPASPTTVSYGRRSKHEGDGDGLQNGPVKVQTNADDVPSASSGAIPKSISFDKTAERGDWDSVEEEGGKHRRGFLRSFKLPFKGRRKMLRGQQQEERVKSYVGWGGGSDLLRPEEHPRLRKSLSEDAHPVESSDDILAKYRCKVSAAEDVTTAPESAVESDATVKAEEDAAMLNADMLSDTSYAFSDAKRKLRLVLSGTDLHNLTGLGSLALQGGDNPLLRLLRLQLAEAINLQDRHLTSQLHETLRCVMLFDDEGCCRLFRSMREEYRRRTPYVAYLVRSRQGLLSTLHHLERLTERLEQDRSMCGRFLVSVCVRIFLEGREGQLQALGQEFQRLTASDEKTDLVERFLQAMGEQLSRDPIWQGCPGQQQMAQLAVEQAVMSQVYLHALYPNGDGDISRDQVLHEHVKKLSTVISVNHKDLRIPKVYHYECPWPSAQAEIAAISAYKMPRDKVRCVLRCSATIVNLLSLAFDKSGSSAAADDIIPVLVFVLIKANPPSLLSTVQYVNNFYGSRMTGEEQYWWTQFCSAVEFIKTMDYTD